ncbi:putative dNase, partial [Escherichia coli 09BKT078844]
MGVWLTFVTVNSITALHFSSVVVMRRRISGRSVPNAID